MVCNVLVFQNKSIFNKRWIIDSESFSFISGEDIIRHKNYYLIRELNTLKIARSEVVNSKLTFRLESSIHLRQDITGIVQGNKNSVLLKTSYDNYFGVYLDLNLDVLEQLQSFPFISEYVDSTSMITYLKELNAFEFYDTEERFIGQYKNEENDFLILSSRLFDLGI